jgi:predicted nuclease of predicted toxin-antitoxin system
VRFFLDHDVQAGVGRALRSRGHDCWSAQEAGLNEATDDSLTVYAAHKNAILVTHDKEFSKRRRRNVAGWHVQLQCPEWDAADLLLQHLDYVGTIVASFEDVFISLSPEGAEVAHGWE